MKSKSIRAWIALALIALGPGLTGCAGKYTGGGWIPSQVDARAKATFGFNMNAEDTDGDGVADTTRGEFQFNDRAANVAFHAVVIEGYFNPEWVWPYGDMLAIYWPIGARPQAAGLVRIVVFDRGEPGGASQDQLYIEVLDGPYAGYLHNAYIGGGNIQFHESKTD